MGKALLNTGHQKRMGPRRYAVALLFLALPALSFAGVDGDVDLAVGRLSLTHEENWDGAGDWRVRGAMLSIGKSGSIVRFEMAYMRTEEQDVLDRSVTPPRLVGTGKIRDVSLGLLGIWPLADGRVRPYVGGGLSMLIAYGWIGRRGNGDALFEDAVKLGKMLHGGVILRIPGGVNLGVDYRIWRGGPLESKGHTAEGDYNQIAGVLGWGWGH